MMKNMKVLHSYNNIMYAFYHYQNMGGQTQNVQNIIFAAS